MNEKVTQALQKAKEIAMPLCAKGKEMALRGYAKGNELMDKVELLKSKTNKLIAWCALGGIAVLVVGFLMFSGGDGPEDAFRKMGASVSNKDVKGFLAFMYDKDGDVSLDKAGEWKELAEKRFKEMLEEEDGRNLGRWMSTSKIISIKERNNKATIKFRPSDAKEWKELKDEGALGMKIDAVKANGKWKIDLGTFEPIMKN